MKRRFLRVAGLLVTLTAACTAEVPPDAAPRAVYVGTVDGTDAVVAFTVNRDTGLINSYVCGGASSYATLSRWFCGEARRVEAGFEFAKTEELWHMQATVEPHVVTGTIESVEGERYELRAERSDPGSHSALYGETDVGGCTTGAIVVHDAPDREPRVHGTWCARGEGGDPRFEQVTPLLPHDFSQDLMQVTVPALDDGERPLLLSRVRP